MLNYREGNNNSNLFPLRKELGELPIGKMTVEDLSKALELYTFWHQKDVEEFTTLIEKYQG